ncbi:MAG: flagellar basal body-associated FliL family protein [Desulfobacterales bacterium]|nr:flagellar basal body-associated FliL family protein [Desulfobacterales bacterium]
MMIGIFVLLLVAVGTAVWFLHIKPSQETAAQKKQQPPPSLHKESFRALWPLDAMEIPISGRMGARTLKVSFNFHLDSEILEDEFAIRKGEVMEGIGLILSGRSVEEMEKSENRIRLKYEVLRLVNGLMETGRVRGVYITEFLIL